MKFSIATLLALAAAAIATPTPGGYDGYDGYNDYDGNDGDYGRLNHVYCTDGRRSILDVNVHAELRTRISQCNRGRGWDDGSYRGIRDDSDEFCRGNDQVHGIWGCTRPCEVGNASPNKEYGK